jgi:flagellar basal body-associated protein FliL
MNSGPPRKLSWLWLALLAVPVVLIVGGLGTFFWRKAEKGEMQPKWRRPAATNAVSPAP